MTNSDTLAPIILLVYNRPNHTRKTLEALMANDLAKDSTLYIFADGPKPGATSETLLKIEETRKVIKEKKWCGTVFIRQYEENYGVDNSMIKHVTELVNKFCKVIVLEDDIVTSKGFLLYMNKALAVYEFEENVCGISGYIYPIKSKLPPTFMIMGANSSWGWATWKRAWDKFNPDYTELINIISTNPELKRKFNYENSYDFYSMLSNCNESHKPWDIRWYASLFIENNYSLWPGKSLVQNIGHDATGEHCGINNDFFHNNLIDYIDVKKLPIEDNFYARQEIVKFFIGLSKIEFLVNLRFKLKYLLNLAFKFF